MARRKHWYSRTFKLASLIKVKSNKHNLAEFDSFPFSLTDSPRISQGEFTIYLQFREYSLEMQ